MVFVVVIRYFQHKANHYTRTDDKKRKDYLISSEIVVQAALTILYHFSDLILNISNIYSKHNRLPNMKNSENCALIYVLCMSEHCAQFVSPQR